MTKVLDLRWALTQGPGTRVPPPLRAAVRDSLVRYRYRGLTSDDLLVAGFPKAGSTWVRFILLELFSGDEPSTFGDVDLASPAVGAHRGAPLVIDGRGRLIKTHEQYRGGPGSRPRAIYVVRDPRDVAVSFFHFFARRRAQEITMEDLLAAFLRGRAMPYGSWGVHARGWVNAAKTHPERVVVLRYEDLLEGGAPTLRSALQSIGIERPLEQVQAAFDHNTAAAMRRKEAATPAAEFASANGDPFDSVPFVRSATAGAWRAEVDPSQAAQLSNAFSVEMRQLGYTITGASSSQPDHPGGIL